MKKFQDIIGREQIIEHLQNAIRFNRVSHAYIFYGEEGIGKNFIADIIPASRAGSVNPVCRLREGTTRILYECGMRKRRSVSMISGTS